MLNDFGFQLQLKIIQMLNDFDFQLSPGSASAQRKAATATAASSSATAASSFATAAATSPATAAPSSATAVATTLLSARQGSTLHQSVKEVLALLHCFLFL
jgi:hypothetical protein